MALPALVLLLTVSLAAVASVITKLRCVDAAREGALMAARGDDGTAAARTLAPPGATVEVTSEREQVRATVRAQVRLGRWSAITVAGEAVSAREPGE